MANIPIYIPTLISDINYSPAKVYPRLYFYNGKLECEPFWMEFKPTSGSASVQQVELTSFPYVDHYNVVTGSFPSQGSKSLLFQNENTPYGATPTSSLYTDYWQTYIELLYDPKTRLINCSGIIPLSDYYKMELNDIVEWRGNSYHLRAINDYDLKTGKCKIQLLGPIIKDTTGVAYDCNFTFTSQNYTTTTTTSTTTTQAPTTTTTTLAPGCPDCMEYRLREQTAGQPSVWSYTDCLDGSTRTIDITSQVRRTFGSRTTPVQVSGANAILETVGLLPYGTGCGPYNFCNYQKYSIVTKNASPPGFIFASYYSTASCAYESIMLSSNSSSYQVTVVEGSMTFGAQTSEVNQYSIIATDSFVGCCNTTTTTSTTSTSTTTTTTASPTEWYYLIRRYTCPGCGGGNTSIGISYTPLIVGQFYGYPGDTECYEIVSSTTNTGWSVDLTYMTPFNSCASYCLV